MNLPDFSKDDKWNSHRASMRADYIEFNITTWTAVDHSSLLDALQTGVEVDLSEITVSPDGTFDFRGVRVLIYIKDQRYFAGQEGEYKFHICNCETIDKFRDSGNLDRYVVSRKTDGKFAVNVYDKALRTYRQKDAIRELKVCKYCLAKLAYKGYISYSRTPKIFDQFSIEEFFSLYKSSQFAYTPNKMSDEAPLNEYTPDFPEISLKFREMRNWQCEQCSLNLKFDKKYLHVHHKNGMKSDNRFSNLECLCLGCHAESAGHERMKFEPDYVSFMMIYKNPWEVLKNRKTLNTDLPF